MASTLKEEPNVDDFAVEAAAIDPAGGKMDQDPGEINRQEKHEEECGEEEMEEYAKTVERLRSLVFSESQNIDEIRRLVVARLPDSACGTEDAISSIRANLWSVMLLGLRPEDLSRLVLLTVLPKGEMNKPLVGSVNAYVCTTRSIS